MNKFICLTYLGVVIVVLMGCQTNQKNSTELIEEVKRAEEAFDQFAQKNGVAAAFIEFAADSAVINRGGRIFKGKAAIADYFKSSTLTEVELTWSPDFVDVSVSGDLAYTYGDYEFHAKDTTGQLIESAGMFHTVWKRQPNGSWKFVYD